MGIVKGNETGKRKTVPYIRKNSTKQTNKNKFRNGGTQNDIIREKPV